MAASSDDVWPILERDSGANRGARASDYSSWMPGSICTRTWQSAQVTHPNAFYRFLNTAWHAAVEHASLGDPFGIPKSFY